jgi:hypothetical protein
MSSPRYSLETIENVDSLQNGLGPKDASTQDEYVNYGDHYGEAQTHEPGRSSKFKEHNTKQGQPSEKELVQGNMADGAIPKHTIERINSNGNGVDDSVKANSPVREESSISLADPMESSTATLRPEPNRAQTTDGLETKPLIISTTYLDPTPKTPSASHPVSRSTSSIASIPQYSNSPFSAERSPTRSDSGFDEKRSPSEDEREVESGSEIQSIMDQFSGDDGGPGVEEVMSPRLGLASPLLGNPVQHPPRKSSLEPLNSGISKTVQSMEDPRLSSPPPSSYQSRDTEKGPIVPPKPSSIHSFTSLRKTDDRFPNMDTPLSPTGNTLHRPPPPELEPEPDLPFDFHRFLEQIRHRTADPVAKFLRSFLLEFGKKQWMVHEQVKIISDFLAFITNKMAQCEVWREVSDAEFDNAREGMEKLVMNRLYTQTFSPAIPPAQPVSGSKPKRGTAEWQIRPGRRGQHQEDVERDDILAQKIRIYGWIKEEHLDITPVGESGRRFLVLAQQGLCLFW